jgi:hypothetical protein
VAGIINHPIFIAFFLDFQELLVGIRGSLTSLAFLSPTEIVIDWRQIAVGGKVAELISNLINLV